MNRWTLEVSNFGKIRHAKVTVAPLTFFLGENNSGKSYLMTLIYGLLTMRFQEKYIEGCRETEGYNRAFAFVREQLSKLETEGEVIFFLPEDVRDSFALLLDSILNKRVFLEELFNKTFEEGEFSVKFYDTYKFRLTCDEKYIIIWFDEESYSLGAGTALVKEEDVKTEYFMSYIMQLLFQKDFMHGNQDILYLPVARTGFLLTYKSVIGSAMQDKFNIENSEKNLLTKPVGDFLTRLGTMSVHGEQLYYQDLVSFIEQHLIKGHIDVSEMPTHDILYSSEQLGQKLPMYLTSGVVTELAPLLLFLERINLHTVLIEEPEISLHPELQISMARLLVRMCNAGIATFVTTHSDLIMQHVNNMIRLSEIVRAGKELPETKYTKEDFIQRNQVAVYEFQTGADGRTEIIPVPCNKSGFAVDTFYQALKKLSEEIDIIEEKME
ncbi:MAG: AAA family ATPase [Lachnospiraceae bacterium]|nr:AAA family ATPase [Lachnospiraceae bacterium]